MLRPHLDVNRAIVINFELFVLVIAWFRVQLTINLTSGN